MSQFKDTEGRKAARAKVKAKTDAAARADGAQLKNRRANRICNRESNTCCRCGDMVVSPSDRYCGGEHCNNE